LKTKKIYIDSGVNLEEWADNHRDTIIECLYENIFDFTHSDELKRVVLKVITKTEGKNLFRTQIDKMIFDFMLVRDDIDVTIDALIRNFEELEDYEKCSELVKLKNEL
jgi:hypothetical protein